MIDIVLFGCLVVVAFELMLTFAVAATYAVGRGGAGRSKAPGDAAPGPSRSSPPVLASDLERDRAARAIGAAMADGRLGLTEGVERIEAALSARYRWQLDALRQDLP